VSDTSLPERPFAAPVSRADAILAVIAAVLAAATAAAVWSPLAALPTLAVGCVGCLVVIGDALFVNPPA